VVSEAKAGGPTTPTQTYAILNSSGGLTQTITEPFYTQRVEIDRTISDHLDEDAQNTVMLL
jgi:hypothetical protein